MKKTILILLLFVSFISFSQEVDNKTSKAELSTNLLDMVIAGSLNVNYERLLKNNQSFYIGATLFDTYGYYDVGNINKNNAFSIKAAYLIYFSKRKDHGGFYFYPLLKLRTGDITTEDDWYYYNGSENYNNDTYFKYDVGGLSAGFGIGHKWLFYNKLSLSISGEVARNLGNFDIDYLDAVEPRFGVSFGYRF